MAKEKRTEDSWKERGTRVEVNSSVDRIETSEPVFRKMDKRFSEIIR